ncbi:hypothetical protein BG006_008330 [Podila minutissima]|uniref:Uncharacterized protein n=1 Tax=Podila minutissima TaxID=64525 RepID=A0A9P5SR60_9FUNG|nr:hypothetical protein BG006_008330 [Podila minutissima]
MDDRIRELFISFRDAERTWVKNQEAREASPGLEECSLHFGELAFVLAGLKPAVLIQLPSAALTRQFYLQVLQPHLVQHYSFASSSLECRMITRSVRSPEMPLTGCALVWNRESIRGHSQSSSIQGALDLLCPPSEAPQGATTEIVVSESDIATLLDIPGRLPGSEEEIHKMLEVSYWQQDASVTSPVLLTAFAAQPEELPAIQIHFEQYKDRVSSLFGITLKLHVQSMAI